jgi:hypothetical protein
MNNVTMSAVRCCSDSSVGCHKCYSELCSLGPSLRSAAIFHCNYMEASSAKVVRDTGTPPARLKWLEEGVIPVVVTS